MSTKNFFEEMEGFYDFYHLTDNQHYVQAPSDWWVVITDVIGSTKAIENGLYKDVNTVGAATLVALKEAIPNLIFPFVFGGDGATAIIPDEYSLPVRKSLSALRKSAKTGFALDLRVGIIQIKELEDMGYPLYIAKYLLKDQLPLALFRGGALVQAENKIKGSLADYEVAEYDMPELNLQLLSCRWEPIKSARGSIITLLFWDPKERQEIYTEFLKELSQILEDNPVNPTASSQLTIQPIKNLWALDKKFQYKKLHLWKRFVESLVVPLLFHTWLSKIPIISNYLREIPSHSDFRKFDDMVRMVLDCNLEQCDKIDHLCLTLKQKYQCHYGTFRSRNALMTCCFEGFETQKHIHFIDGDEGGYAMAAKQLKAQIKEASL